MNFTEFQISSRLIGSEWGILNLTNILGLGEESAHVGLKEDRDYPQWTTSSRLLVIVTMPTLGFHGSWAVKGMSTSAKSTMTILPTALT